MQMRLRRIAGIAAPSQQLPLFDPLPLPNDDGMLLEMSENQVFAVIRPQHDRVARRKERIGLSGLVVFHAVHNQNDLPITRSNEFLSKGVKIGIVLPR